MMRCDARLLVAAVVALLAVGLRAEDWFVSNVTGQLIEGVERYDGKSPTVVGGHGPFFKIQSAVDAAVSGDVISVGPGVYGDDQGTVTDELNGAVRNRVVVQGKSLTIRGSSGPSQTHVVGKRASNGSRQGAGEDAVRCFSIGGIGCDGTMIQGLTIRDGASQFKNNGANEAANCGGGVHSDRRKVYLVDCVVSNCVATRGGAVINLRTVRSKFAHNRLCAGYNGGQVSRYCDHYASVFIANGCDVSPDHECVDSPGEIDQCTFVGNLGGAVKTGGSQTLKVRNSVFVQDFMTGDAPYSIFVQNAANPAVVTNSVVTGIRVGDGATVTTESTVVVGVGNPYAIVSPYEGDYRPVAKGFCDGKGCATLADPTWVPEACRGLDFNGQKIVAGGKCNIGAVAESVEMSGGFLAFEDDHGMSCEIAGAEFPDSVTNTVVAPYLGSAVWPRQVRVRARSEGRIKYVVRVEQKGVPGMVDSNVPFRYTDNENRVALTFPPAGVVFTNRFVWATNVRYVSPSGTDTVEDDYGQREEKPWRTLHYAVGLPGIDSTKRRGTVVIALPGTYGADEGTTSGQSANNRVYIDSTMEGSLLRSRDGAENTIIEGVNNYRSAGNTFDSTAVRCLAITGGGNRIGVQGFTFKNGCAPGSSTDASSIGGGVYGGNQKTVVEDSVFTGCSANRGGAAGNVMLRRCIFKDNDCPGQGPLRNAWASSCVFYDNKPGNSIFGDTDIRVWFCSGYETKKATDTVTCAYNCVTAGGGGWPTVDMSKGEFVGNYTKDASAVLGVSVASKLFVDETNRDLRLLADSEAVFGGVATDFAKTFGGSNAAADWALHVVEGIDGHLMSVRSGKPTAGAYQGTALKVRVTSSAGLEGDVEPFGEITVSAGCPLAVTATGSKKRRFVGFAFDGALTESARTFVLDVPDLVSTAMHEIKAVYQKDWYVNATSGNDANSGWDPMSARRTLKEGVADAVTGDTVHLAAGTYNQETMTYEGNVVSASGSKPFLRCRVAIPEGVTLLGDAGAEQTIIVGAGDPAGKESDYYFGANAIRCAFLESNAVIRAVTLTGGRVMGGNSGDGRGLNDDDNYAAAALGRGRKLGHVVDCVVSNCVGNRSGCFSYLTAVRCRIVANLGLSTGTAGREANFHTCFFDKNEGSSTSMGHDYLVNCTVTTNNPPIKDFKRNGFACGSVLMSGIDYSGEYSVSNCYVSSGITSIQAKKGVMDVEVKTWEELKIGDDGIPDKDSPVVDHGVAEASCDKTDFKPFGNFDARGGQRIYNGGAQDLGAVEYDWRGIYAADLSQGNVKVLSAAPAVCEFMLADGGKVVRLGGGAVEFSISHSELKAKHRLAANVVDGGELRLYAVGDSEPVYVWTVENTGSRYRWRNDSLVEFYRVEYVSDDSTDGYAWLNRIDEKPGLMVLVR